MPYKAIKNLPAHAKDIYESTAKGLKGRKNPRTGKPYTDEERGKIAWSAVKRKYGKSGEKWKKHNNLFISKNMELDLEPARLLALHAILHKWYREGDNWTRPEIQKLHKRVVDELKNKKYKHKKKKPCSLDAYEENCEEVPPEVLEEDYREFPITDYDLEVLNNYAENIKLEEKNLQRIYVENSIMTELSKIKMPFKFNFAALTEGKFNNIYYPEEELKKHGKDLTDKPLSIDHGKSVRDIVGKITESFWNEKTKRIEGTAETSDEEIANKIENGEISGVSVEVYVTHDETDEGTVGKDLDFVGLSLVKSPACKPDDGCGIISK